ncbi:MAG: FapA family protein [Desulfobacterales bacterium]|nr:FapA family protein [Desulfobacterales bacterium]
MNTEPTALVIEPHPPIRDLIRENLERDGWKLTFKDSPKAALELMASKAMPFMLLISGWHLPEMEGSEVIRQAEKISPMTQRMLVIPEEDNNYLIQAINTAHIHACLSFPFEGQDLVNQALTCRAGYQEWEQKNRYKRVIERQNEQLYEVAQRLKGKNQGGRKRIQERKSKLEALERREQELDQQQLMAGELTLPRIVEHLDRSMTPETVAELFTQAGQSLANHLRELAQGNDMDWSPPEITRNALVDIDLTALDESEPPPLVEAVRGAVYMELLTGVRESEAQALAEEGNMEVEPTERDLLKPDTYLTLTPAPDGLSAQLTAKRELNTQVVTLPAILEFARLQGIEYGLADDPVILDWIESNPSPKAPLTLAQGDTPVPAKDGAVEYFFEINYTNPGKILENGTIDFRDRGNIPYVDAHTLLGRKTPAEKGIPGKDIYGQHLPVDEPFDPPFEAGTGTYEGGGGTEIMADVHGQPHLDAMGCVTVNEEMIINGDVDFNTGNIDFAGNIVVKGTVKEGFSVKGVSLTAKSVEGAVIELTGDLSVSNGMTNTTVKNVANVHTKFVNNCRISGFGDLMAFKEVVDSTIVISGECRMPTGSIIASTISATQGVDARIIGTETSTPPLIKVGLADHVENLKKANAKEIEGNMEVVEKINGELDKIKARDKRIHMDIAQATQARDRSQKAISDEVRRVEAFKKAGETQKAKALVKTIKNLQQREEAACQEINQLFEQADQLGMEADIIKAKVRQREEENVELFKKKRQMDDYIRQCNPAPRVAVQSKILQDTRIMAPNVSITLNENRSRCLIQEEEREEDNLFFHEITFSPLR